MSQCRRQATLLSLLTSLTSAAAAPRLYPLQLLLLPNCIRFSCGSLINLTPIGTIVRFIVAKGYLVILPIISSAILRSITRDLQLYTSKRAQKLKQHSVCDKGISIVNEPKLINVSSLHNTVMVTVFCTHADHVEKTNKKRQFTKLIM